MRRMRPEMWLGVWTGMWLGALGLGCGPVVPGDGLDSSTSAGTEGQPGGSTDGTFSTSDRPANTSAQESTTTPVDPATGSSDDGDVVCLVDGQSRPLSYCDIGPVPECYPPAVNCPEGEKCSLDSTCEPIDPNPSQVGEPCTVAMDGGIDDCVADAVCVAQVPEEEGLCYRPCPAAANDDCQADELCIEDLEPDEVCTPRCDPFSPACPDGTVCMFYWDQGRFACSLPVIGVAQEGQPCTYDAFGAPHCDDGLVCEIGPNQCRSLCAFPTPDDPDPVGPDCPAEQVCVYLGAPEHPDVGVCDWA